MSMISYAQNYEDVMLMRALADVSEGFYIDVGAQHPVNGSVTKAFELRGWRGINIEPVEQWFRLICEDRPKDINLGTLISDVPGYVELFDVEDTGLSTLRQDYAEHYSKEGWSVFKKRLKAHTLNSVFRAYAPKDVHFLKIDVEGAEAAVLRSLDLNRFRPWIILIEATKPNSTEPTFSEWEHHLLGNSYLFAYDDGLNRFYVAFEHEGRVGHFSRPPNFFDDFILYSESWARAQMDRLSAEVEQAQAESQQIRKDYDAAVVRANHMEDMRADLGAILDEKFETQGRQLKESLDGRVKIVVDERLAALDVKLAALSDHFDKTFNDQVQTIMDGRLRPVIDSLAKAESAIVHVHERLGFADNVHAALLNLLQSEREAGAKLQQILLSRSWRVTKGPRFIARVLRSLVQRSLIAMVRFKNVRSSDLLMAAANRPTLRRMGSFFLKNRPDLKARLARVIESNSKPEAPPPASFNVMPPNSSGLPGRARVIRSMIDSAKKSS